MTQSVVSGAGKWDMEQQDMAWQHKQQDLLEGTATLLTGELPSGGYWFCPLSNLIRPSSSSHTDKRHCWQEQGEADRACQETPGCRGCVSLLLLLEDSGNSTPCGANRWRSYRGGGEAEDYQGVLRRNRLVELHPIIQKKNAVRESSVRVRVALTLLPSGRRRPKSWGMETGPC